MLVFIFRANAGTSFAYHKEGEKNKCLYLFSEPTQGQKSLIFMA